MKSSKPYYSIAADPPNYEIPGSATLKSVGGKVVYGIFYVYHRNQAGERFPWIVRKEEPITDDTVVSGDIEAHAQYREALRHAAKLDREHLASAKPKSEEDKAA